MSSLPTDPEDPVARLYADGYDLALRNGHLFIRQIPYLSPAGVRTDGLLVLPINDSGPLVTDAIGDHTIWFEGDEPRDQAGGLLGSPAAREVGDGQRVSYMLSFKTHGDTYPSLYEKVRSYARILRSSAQSVDPEVTDRPGAAFQAVADDLPLVYRDTNTSRAGLMALSNLFRGHTIAIVGLGGTGSYILDQIAKTWVDRIILIDGDQLEEHNAFRAPGAASYETVQAKPNKAQYYAGEYSRMHTGIVAHAEALTASNLHLIAGTTFAFLAAADAAERPHIMAWLTGRGIPFIDVGMGISYHEAGLSGVVKTLIYPQGHSIDLPDRPAVAPGENDYATNIQVADLNALNALLAVIAWKRSLGFYASHTPSHEIVYKLYLNELRNGDVT